MTSGSTAEMADGNPYESPNCERGIEAIERPLRPPYVWSVILLFIGGCCLLLLNGQFFSNTLVFLGFTAVIAMIWIRYVVRSWKNTRTWLGIFLLLAHVVVMIAYAARLPADYRRQQEFNRKMNDAIERVRQIVE
jgi:cell division protein FtsW (lipid II flippase)